MALSNAERQRRYIARLKEKAAALEPMSEELRRAYRAGTDLLEVVMPNGKKLRDCTHEELRGFIKSYRIATDEEIRAATYAP
jgi:hypothetical protein